MLIISLTFRDSWTWIICSGHVEAAIKSYKQALALRPDFPEATCNLLHTLQVHIGLTYNLQYHLGASIQSSTKFKWHLADGIPNR